jgi:hypothetical protein
MSLGLADYPDPRSVGSLTHVAVQHRLGLLSLGRAWVDRTPRCDPPAHRQNLAEI